MPSLSKKIFADPKKPPSAGFSKTEDSSQDVSDCSPFKIKDVFQASNMVLRSLLDTPKPHNAPSLYAHLGGSNKISKEQIMLQRKFISKDVQIKFIQELQKKLQLDKGKGAELDIPSLRNNGGIFIAKIFKNYDAFQAAHIKAIGEKYKELKRLVDTFKTQNTTDNLPLEYYNMKQIVDFQRGHFAKIKACVTQIDALCQELKTSNDLTNPNSKLSQFIQNEAISAIPTLVKPPQRSTHRPKSLR